MTNSEIINKLKSLKMLSDFTLTLEDAHNPGLWPFLPPFDYTKVRLESDYKILDVRIIHDDDDPCNNKVAQGALMIVEAFTQ